MRYPFVSLELFPLKFSVKPGTPRRAAIDLLAFQTIVGSNFAYFCIPSRYHSIPQKSERYLGRNFDRKA